MSQTPVAFLSSLFRASGVSGGHNEGGAASAAAAAAVAAAAAAHYDRKTSLDSGWYSTKEELR